MSALIDDGGPAFPVPGIDVSRDERVSVDSVAAYTGEGGMSLRDYFAAAALQSILTVSFESKKLATTEDCELAVRNAYDWAEGLIREKRKREGKS